MTTPNDTTGSRVRFCAGPNGCVFNDLYTGAPLENCRYCGRTREEAHSYPPHCGTRYAIARHNGNTPRIVAADPGWMPCNACTLILSDLPEDVKKGG